MSRDSQDVSRTWDQLVNSELQHRRALKSIDDPRRPRDKSPVLVKLVWDGEEPLPPGHVVKLGAVVFDPENEESAPFSGLQFHCTTFDALDTAKGYAISLDSINNVGYGIIPESAWVKLNVVDVGHSFAKIVTGGTLFDSATDGLPILWKQSGAGEKWAVVLLVPTSTSTTQVPLRRFQLTANKTLASAVATAKFMAFDNSLIGPDATLHDAAQIFAGKTGFRGYAIQRTDLGSIDPDRWEIILMERYAEFIVAEKYDPTTYHFVSTLSSEDDWWRIAPVTAGNPITIADPAFILGSIPTEQKIIARLSNPDTSPPIYDAISTFVSGGGRRVRGTVVNPGSGFVSRAASTFEIENLTEVYGGPPPAAPLTVQQTFAQGYVAGQLTEAIFNEDSSLWENLPLPRKLGCHLDVNANGFEFVTPSTLAGSGLSVSAGTGPGGCDQLTASGSSYAEGYCVEIEDLATDKLHLNQITNAAGVQATGIDTNFQFWVHDYNPTARTDAKWKTAASYSDAAAFQFLISLAGSWKFETLDDYSAGATQLILNASSDWKAKTIAGYSEAKKQVFHHENGAWKALDIPPTGTQLLGSVSGVLQFKTLDNWDIQKESELPTNVCDSLKTFGDGTPSDSSKVVGINGMSCVLFPVANCG